MNRNHLLLVFILVLSTSVFAQTNEDLEYAWELAQIGMWDDAFRAIDDQRERDHKADLAFYQRLTMEALRQGNDDAQRQLERRTAEATSPAGVPCTPISPPVNNHGLDSTNCFRHRPGVVREAVQDMDEEYANAEFDAEEDIVRRLSLNGADISK